MSASTHSILEAIATAKRQARIYSCDYFVCVKDKRVLLLTELARANIKVDEVVFSTRTGYKAA